MSPHQLGTEEQGMNTSSPVPAQVRTLPKVLKYLPVEKAQDARNFVNGLQYWLVRDQHVIHAIETLNGFPLVLKH